VIHDRAALTIWSFTPSGHPAHPAVVRRVVVRQDGAMHVKMSGLCEATKPACDKLWTDFEQLNEQMRKTIEQERGPRAQ
jgi:hypothetical protein